MNIMSIEEIIEVNHKFRKSKAWRTLTQQVYQRSHGQCECPGGYNNGGETESGRCSNPIKHIHHLIYPIVPETTMLNELQGLCSTCHETRHEKNSVLDTLPCCRYRNRPTPHYPTR